MSYMQTPVKAILLFSIILLASCFAGSDTTGVNNGNGNGNGDGSGTGKYIFAGTAHAIFRSSDSGATWTATNAGPVQWVGGFATFGNTIFAATAGGILASSDNGMTWGLTGDSINALSVYRYNNYLLAGTNYGILRSSDGGKTWPKVHYAGGMCAFASNGAEVIAACFYSGGGSLYRSSDSGATWYQSNYGMLAEDLAAVACDDSIFYAGSSRQGGFRSTDRGRNWKPIDVNTQNIFAMANQNGTIYAGTDRGIMRSMLHGQVWSSIGSPGVYAQTALLFSGPYLYCGTSRSGVFRTDDTGLTWKHWQTGLTDSAILSLGGEIVDILDKIRKSGHPLK